LSVNKADLAKKSATLLETDFYARKQLRLSHRNSVRPSVRLSACLSHGWISQKQCKLESPSLHRRLFKKL